MKKIIRYTLFILFIALQNRTVSFAQNILVNVKRIVFLGNSITYAGNYVTDIEAYFVTHYPGRHIEFINVGLPSETVSGLTEPGHAGGKFPRPDLHERLDRVLAKTKPDLVFASYGMNDGIYMPFDTSRFDKFKEGINWLHKTVLKSGAKIIHVTPPVYDELKGKSLGYAAVLDKYSEWLLSLRTSQKWEVIDIHFPMKKYLEAHRKVDSAFATDGFALAPDGIHPGETGHWMMAKQILSYLGIKDVASAPDISATLKAVRNGPEILKLVDQRQTLMKHAWLTATKHTRPEIPVGLPLDEAMVKYAELEHQIQALL